jgi:hypothetical protein
MIVVAVEARSVAGLELLIKKGANVNDRSGKCPLRTAIRLALSERLELERVLETEEILVKHGATEWEDGAEEEATATERSDDMAEPPCTSHGWINPLLGHHANDHC